jgi:hypothetical protein
MPYSIEKYKNGFRLVDLNGHYYSNKPMTKKKVIAQMKAVSLSKHKKHKLFPQYVRETNDYSGGGFTDWVKGAISKVKDVATDIKDRAVGFVTGVRDDYPPDVRDLLKKYGNNNVVKILVRRDPLQKAVEIASNIISLGAMEISKRQEGYDSYFHLYMIVTLDNGISLLIEKNEVINIEEYNKPDKQGEKYDVIMPNPIVLNTMLSNTKNGMGIKKYFYYDAITNNCQVFLNAIMQFNNLLQLNKGLHEFIMQDMSSLIKNIPSVSRTLMSGVTDLARRFNILIRGKGFDTAIHHNLV